MVHGVIFVAILLILALFGVEGAFEKLTDGCFTWIFWLLVYGGIIAFVFNGGLTSGGGFHYKSLSPLVIIGPSFAVTVLLSWIIWGVNKEKDSGCLICLLWFISLLTFGLSSLAYIFHLLGIK